MSIDFTVAIPTYNGAIRLPKVLDKLRSQTGTEQISWEVIVIDNNSTDETAKVVKEYQLNWSSAFPLRYTFETEQGLAFARRRAVQEARGNFIGFLDDDNVPVSDWVSAAYKFGQDYPKAGAFSGQIHGEFEVEPPEEFKKIQAFLAIREHGSKPHLFEPQNLRLPPGAGLVIRKQAWCESVPNWSILTGRVGKSLVAGEDYEVLLHLYKAGWEIWYNPQMHIAHQIPCQRLEREYLLHLARGTGLATCQLRMINAKGWQKPIIFARTLLGNSRRLIVHFLKYRQKIETDLITAFEREFFWGSFMSPFYFLQKSRGNKK
ncbi:MULTISPECIES: hormogonium polysaccharide biosynthesis glycosyltransferase HpsE [unclassified Coleofasciculus]|uniref:hormogonium polysaccharide biosynthesis glycosyltransferase HpsE n=1 Tax=unclassified Coleofasciculus TaxID=2692782 RepID=UPI001882D176|nr:MULTISPECIES: hormogonium polysaccharide biosynthesis glycosyltransferase HpsE [unclassified Coleofasciculus]MBE9126709.1 glycosyltransferase family 2 protein [Coleofasciculus sp. LEGE 07081]MBE9150069.1 glycosyltransferase family 2 protein [Coleofasciculus sp. LEGE 07092]